MDTKELRTMLVSQNNKLVQVMAGAGKQADAKERMKNLLFNFKDDIIAALLNTQKLEEDVKLLELELADAERELDELTRIKPPELEEEDG